MLEGAASGTDKRLFLEAALLLRIARRGLRLFGFRHLVRTLGRGAGADPYPSMLDRVAEAVNRAADGNGYSCLPRAFAAAWMLRRRGFAPTLHYGVRRTGGEAQAHVWLDVQGHPVIGHEEARDFSLLASFPSPSTARR